ncbi:MAG: hypothetical protein AAF483_27515 [Planctomycetota bacterium]
MHIQIVEEATGNVIRNLEVKIWSKKGKRVDEPVLKENPTPEDIAEYKAKKKKYDNSAKHNEAIDKLNNQLLRYIDLKASNGEEYGKRRWPSRI